VCLANSATTHIILRDKIHFTSLTLKEANVNTISCTINLIEGSRIANIMLLGETEFHISNTLYFRKSKRNLLSFKDIHCNRYHIETKNESNINFLYITLVISCQNHILKKLPALSSKLHHITIRPIKSHVIMN